RRPDGRGHRVLRPGGCAHRRRRGGDGNLRRGRHGGVRPVTGEGVKEIIARNSYCGDAEEQDYVEALALQEVAHTLVERFFHVISTSEPYCGQARSWLYMEFQIFSGACLDIANVQTSPRCSPGG